MGTGLRFYDGIENGSSFTLEPEIVQKLSAGKQAQFPDSHFPVSIGNLLAIPWDRKVLQ
jgi:hypothetical protein